MNRGLELEGQRFGHLTVLKRLDERENRYIMWLCRCDCGNEIKVNTRRLVRGTVDNCGCILEKTARRGPVAEDLTGQRFGKLVAVRRIRSQNGRTRWECRCDCGNIHIVTAHALKYGVTDYLLKPVNAEELTQLLIRIREEEEKKRRLDNWTASVDRQLRENEWKKREQLVDNLREYAQENRELNGYESLNQEYGCDFHEGTYQVIIIKPDIPSAEEHGDAYRIMMKRSLSVVQKALEQFADESAAAVHAEGIMVVIYKEKYDPVQLRQFLTRVRREIENQRDLFWGIIVTMAMGGEKHRIQELPQSMKEAVQLCKNRITGGKGGWLSWDAGDNETREDYEMLPEERKYFQEIGEYLDSKKISMEVARTEGIMTARRASGSQIYDCYMEISDAVLTGIRQNEKLDIDKIRKDLIYGFYRCTTTSEAFGFLREYISDLIENFEKKKETKEQKPITEARKYIQEHYLEPLKLEDVSKHIGFNATYFSSVFKKETGKNFLDYVTELRMNKAKQLLCSGEMSVNDVAEAVGYQDLKYFSRLFKKNAGISPSDYKKMYQ